MSTRPTVTATCEVGRHVMQSMEGWEVTTPGVRVEVAFDLHDHESALRMLRGAVADVEAQIAETTEPSA